MAGSYDTAPVSPVHDYCATVRGDAGCGGNKPLADIGISDTINEANLDGTRPQTLIADPDNP